MRIGVFRTVTCCVLLYICAMQLPGQHYSEMMRKKQLDVTMEPEPLTLPKSPPASLTTPNGNINLTEYQPELLTDDLPPHLAQLLGMLLYYTNGTVYVVYTNPEALHHQRGIRAGHKILSINGKHVGLYKKEIFDQLDEIRMESDIYLHCETGNSGQQQILILPNITTPDRNLKKLLLAMKRKSKSLWQPKISTTQIPRPSFNPNPSIPRSVLRGSVKLFGMQVGAHKDHLVVKNVAPRSAAASAAIGAGDEIISINHRPVAGLQTNDLRQIAKTEPVLIEWRPQKSRQFKRGYFNNSLQK